MAHFSRKTTSKQMKLAWKVKNWTTMSWSLSFRTREKRVSWITYHGRRKNLKTFPNYLNHSKVLKASVRKQQISCMATSLKTKPRVDTLRYSKCHLVVSCSRETKMTRSRAKSQSKSKIKSLGSKGWKRYLRAPLRKFFSTIVGASPAYSLRSEKTR